MSALRPCAGCGKPCQSETTGLCNPCRASLPKPPNATCPQCGERFRRRKGATFCSRLCFARADGARRRALRTAVTAHARRVDRDSAAIGLGVTARLRLLHKWQMQGRACWYCPRPADTVDHLIPLARGGTNYEGNLVPACRSCNSRKQDRLPIEHRLGRNASFTWQPFRERPRVVRPPVEPKPTAACAICTAEFVMTTKVRVTCGSGACQDEYVRRLARERYRERAGLPATWDRPVRRRAA